MLYFNIKTMKNEIKATANHSKRTFTLRKDGVKYKTDKFDKSDFEDAQFWTSNDWQNYLRNAGYSIIKK